MSRPRAALAALLTLGLAGCGTDPTQLVVIVETDLPVPDGIASVELSVIGPSGMEQTFTEDVADLDAFPLTFGLRPSSGELGPVEVTARGRDAAGTEVVKTAAAVTLQREQTRVLVLYLVQSCAVMMAGSGCGAGRACRPTGCGPLEVDLSDLPVWAEDSDRCRYDRDADGDGSVDEPCGGPDCGWGNPATRPGSPELCDRLDNDCDDSTDEGCGCSPVGATEACTTTCGSPSLRTCEDPGTWGTCTPGAEICNGVDDDCNGLTDDGIDWVVQRTLDVSPTAASPRVVRSGDQWSVIYDSTDAALPGSLLARISDDGTLTTPVPVETGGRTSVPAVAWTGSQHAVVFVEPFDYECGCDPCFGCSTCTDHPLFLVLADAAGTPMGTPTMIHANVGGDAQQRIVWTGSELVVTWRSGGMQLMRFDGSGTMLADAITVMTTREGNPRPAVLLDGTLGLGWSQDELHFAFGPASMLMPETIVATRDMVRPMELALASTGGGWVAAYFDRVTNSYGALGIGADGTRRGKPLAVSMMFPAAMHVDAAGSNGQALVAWTSLAGSFTPGIQVTRVSPDGMMIQPTLHVADIPAAGGIVPVMDVSGAHAAIAWTDGAALKLAQLGCGP